MGSTIYYAHSKLIYDSPREKKEIALITKRFPASFIYNPNNTEVQTSVYPMELYLREIARKTTAGIVFSSYLGHVGKGVYTEIEAAWLAQKLVYMIQEGEVIPFDWCLRLLGIDWQVKYAVVERRR